MLLDILNIFYLFEDEERAGKLIETMRTFEIAAKTVQRKRYTVVYIKESEDIVKLLNVMGAPLSFNLL